MLKSVLTLLLSKFVKRSDTEFIASQPMANDYANRVVLETGVFGTFERTYIAPSNGWVAVSGGNGLVNIYLVNDRSGISTRLQNEQILLAWPHIYLPCAKGDAYKIAVNASQTQSEGTAISFFPSIGG